MPRQSDSLHRGLSHFLLVDGAFDSTCCDKSMWLEDRQRRNLD